MARFLKWFHLVMIFVWLGLAIPGLILWKEALIFVIILSLYANIAAEFSAYQAARAELKQDEQNGRENGDGPAG